MIEVNFKPLNDYVLIKRDAATNQTASGLILTKEQKSLSGLVVAIGTGKWEHGRKIPLDVKVGDRIHFESILNTSTIQLPEGEFALLKEICIIGVEE